MLLRSRNSVAPPSGGRAAPRARPLMAPPRVASRRRLPSSSSPQPPPRRPAAPPSFQKGGTASERGALEEMFRLRSNSSSKGDDGGVGGGDRDLVLLPQLWPRLAARYGDAFVALEDPRAVVGEEGDDGDGKKGVSITYSQLEREVAALAAGLARLGLARGERVALFADGSARWLVADQAVMRLGCADAVRGASSPPEELAFIAAHSRSSGLIFQNAEAFLRAAPELLHVRAPAPPSAPAAAAAEAPSAPPPPPLRAPKFVVLLWGGKGSGAQQREEVRAAAEALGVPSGALVTYGELVGGGGGDSGDGNGSGGAPPAVPLAPVAPISPTDLATVVYTSGTTGARPKGCPLTHANLAYQLQTLPARVGVRPGDVSLALLPPWHVYARVAQYLVLSSGGKERFSSARHLKDDLQQVRPAFLVAVPLLLEALHARATARVASQRPWYRAAVARFLIVASEAFVVARRGARGLDVVSAAEWGAGGGGEAAAAAASLLSLLRRAAAAFVAAVLAPLHALARLLVWGKVREGLGVRKAVVSGGASLPPHLDAFFEAAGIELTSGYGLTETSPVLACRGVLGAADVAGGGGGISSSRSNHNNNVRGTVGRPLPGTRLRVVDPETLRPLPDGQRGLVLARGPGVFGGYLDDPVATAAAFPVLPSASNGEREDDDDDDDEQGGRWFSTGDLGFVLPASAGPAAAGCLVLSGRAKDTIVLLSGENVEPEPIEGALVVSPLIKHALLVGQDRRELGVLVFPSEEAEEKRRQAGEEDAEAAATTVEAEIERDVARLNAARPGHQPWEHVAHVVVAWGAALSPDDGTLTRTFKVRRAAALERHAKAYERLLGELRG